MSSSVFDMSNVLIYNGVHKCENVKIDYCLLLCGLIAFGAVASFGRVLKAF